MVSGVRPKAVPLTARVMALSDRLTELSFTTLLSIWFGLVVASGIAYWLLLAAGTGALRESGAAVEPGAHGLLVSIYFSFVTATSIGFGDVVPVGPARFVAIVEAVLALLLFGLIVSKMVSHRQEQLVEEIHAISYENRLGRLLTNLHLVLSELQLASSQASAAGLTAERTVLRLESTTMLLAGELRTIHDLLFRPQELPQESLLESLLANLASTLRELGYLLSTLPDCGLCSEALARSLETIQSLAVEICGDCVPAEYAPVLKGWMDRVHEAAGALKLPPRPAS